MKLYHFTKEPFVIKNEVYTQIQNFKPRGLWLSDENSEDSWSCWCTQENFNVTKLKCCTQIDVDTTHVLMLATAREVIYFTDKYVVKDRYSPISFCIDWPSVTEDYSGIIITPYQHELRLDRRCTWYYAWDCASGVIWDLGCVISAVARINP